MTTPCQFLGKLHATGSHHPDVYHCLAGRVICTLEQSELRTASGPVASCDRCESFFVPGQIDPDRLLDPDLKYLVCPYREKPTGEQLNASGCGCDRQIYHCELKGRCVKRLPPGRRVESFGEQLTGVTICKDCEVPNESKPNTEKTT
jgi:hypothetical protein